MIAASVLVRGNRAHMYDAEWVNRLHRALDRHAPAIERHVCLTDVPRRGLDSHIEPIAIGDWWEYVKRAWSSFYRKPIPGHWAKVHLWCPELSGIPPGSRILYSDIDNLIVGSLEPLLAEAEGHDFATAPNTAPNFNPPGVKVVHKYSSAFMVWTHGALADVFADFRPSVTRFYCGDQDWLGERRPDDGHVFPMSYFRRGTYYLRRGLEPGPQTRVIFCTKTKNAEFVKAAPWAREHWQ